MGVLDDKVAIVTGSARGIGRATAELLARARREGGDQRPRRGRRRADGVGDRGRDGRLRGRPHQARRARRARADGDRRLGPDRHHRQQRGLHDRRADPQDERRRVPAHARHPHGRPVPRDPRGGAAPARAGQGGARGGRARCSARSSTSPRSRARWATPGQANYAAGKAGRRRADQDAGQGVGPVQDQRQRGRVRLDRDAADGVEGGREPDGDRRRRRCSSASRTRCAAWRRC